MLCRKWPLRKGSSAKASYIFLVHRLVWKVLLISHICAGAAFRLPAGCFNRSNHSREFPPPCSNPVFWFHQGTCVSFKSHSLVTGFQSSPRKLPGEKRGRQLLLKYQNHCKTKCENFGVGCWEWMGPKGSEVNDNLIMLKVKVCVH